MNIEHHLQEKRSFNPPFLETAHCKSLEEYETLYRHSVESPAEFWLEKSSELDWIEPPQRSLEWSWSEESVEHTCFADGVLNVSYNCIDRHLSSRGGKPALVWQGDENQQERVITYSELHEEVCKLANALKEIGVAKGDRVCIYMPQVPEMAFAMLACARIGAVHSVVFGGFSSESLAHRIEDCEAKLLITANQGVRGGKCIPLKKIADSALSDAPSVEKVIVLKRSGEEVQMVPGRDLWYHDLVDDASSICPAEPMNAEDPLFILYTSGSTGKPKGVLHTHAGYLLYAMVTHRMIFDIQEEDVYWCTADLGWVTGHSYVVYGPLANGATSVMFEGSPLYPDAGRLWQVCEKHGVTKFYTAPTAIRSLISHGSGWPKKYDLSKLKILGTVGEPMNPEAWIWYHEEVGAAKAPIVDTWWQTETGGILISPLPYAHTLKPGSVCKPFFGIAPKIVAADGKEVETDEGGYLCVSAPWPGMMRTMWGDHQRFIDTYFSRFPGLYFSGDGARVDSDGDYWLMGRVDDVVNISGHRLGTAEVESALVEHPYIAEAAVVTVSDPVKGEALVAFLIANEEVEMPEDLLLELNQLLRKEIGPIAALLRCTVARELPKTRSGKIMRRVLRHIARGEEDALGDLTTLADPDLVKELIEELKSS